VPVLTSYLGGVADEEPAVVELDGEVGGREVVGGDEADPQPARSTAGMTAAASTRRSVVRAADGVLDGAPQRTAPVARLW